LKFMRTDRPRYTLAETLPRALKKLRLYVYDECLFDEWTREVRDLLIKKRNLAPDLEYIFVEYWNLTEDESIQGILDTKQKRDRLNTIKWTIKELMNFGNEVGVQIEVLLNETAKSQYESE